MEENTHTTGLDIPIIKLTVQWMEKAILHALDPEILSKQLHEATTKALAECDFENMAKIAIERIAEEVYCSDSITEPIRECFEEILSKKVGGLLEQLNPPSPSAQGEE